MQTSKSRRDILKLGCTTALASAAIGCQTTGAPLPRTEASRRRVVRIAHLTDMHLKEELDAEKWAAACLHHAQSLSDPPDLVINGGDVIMDSLHAEERHVRTQWEIVTRTFRNECSLPILHCLGNHDVWGWDLEKSKASPADPRFGKAWAREALSLERLYYHHDVGNWRLIFLDSNHTGANRVYDARLDEEQFRWFAELLRTTAPDRHVMIVSHIPILSAAAYFDGDNIKTGDWIVPGSWMHQDARELKDLFLQHQNVRLAISGHIHLVDRVDYNGVTYLCNGAVSGNWWKGLYHETGPGYAVVDLYSDGTFASQYVDYGWQPLST